MFTEALKLLVISAVLFVAAFYDHAAFRIPNLLILYGLGARVLILIIELFTVKESLGTILLSNIIATGALIVLSLICLLVIRNGLGMGDIKLFILMGLFQGVQGVISSVFTTLIIAFVYAVFLLITKKKTRNDYIAFAPCILIGTYISIILSGM